VERRDPYTAGHQRRVAALAAGIAHEMGFNAEQVEQIRISGFVHDLGKISVPAEILSKPGRLSELEMNIIREHPTHGYEILQDVESGWDLAEIVYQHHERLDGSGYPRGLKGEEIRLEARILSVADVVEAMASYRPYRPAVGLKEALEEIETKSGVLYDPEVVRVCLELFREKGYQLEE
jgi:putative nucleotidyltransferase with HDIG domain